MTPTTTICNPISIVILNGVSPPAKAGAKCREAPRPQDGYGMAGNR